MAYIHIKTGCKCYSLGSRYIYLFPLFNHYIFLALSLFSSIPSVLTEPVPHYDFMFPQALPPRPALIYKVSTFLCLYVCGLVCCRSESVSD